MTTVRLTESFKSVVHPEILRKYQHIEVRNAAAVLLASDSRAFSDIQKVLAAFQVYDSDIITAGGNRGPIAVRLDTAFAALGWQATRIDTAVTLVGKVKADPTRGKYGPVILNDTVNSVGYEVDNLNRRVALDVEWNAKDGNLDRDLSAYRALYEYGLLDVAVLITRDHFGIRTLALEDLDCEDGARRLGTSTTTNMHKLEERLKRGDAGGCPVWAVGITRATWAGPNIAAPPRDVSIVEAGGTSPFDDRLPESLAVRPESQH